MKLNVCPVGWEFDPKFIKFFESLECNFTDRSLRHIRDRKIALARSKSGHLPNYLPACKENQTDWRIELPEWVRDQRNQMTGPADDARLVVKMLNSGSPGVMIDLEDSMANTWPNLLRGLDNARGALVGTLSYEGMKIDNSPTVIFTRVRGLHITQSVLGREVPAPLFDLAMLTYGLSRWDLKHPLCIYIPKSESAEEAKWWDDVFSKIEELKAWPNGYIRAMALVESHPLAYQMEEFAYNLRNRLLGFNLGRWDYMASFIEHTYNKKDGVFPDRNSIPTDIPFFQNLRNLMVYTCHKHGMLAIGGMTALYPNRKNEALNERAMKVLYEDKRNEAECGFSGAWTGHPDQNDIAVSQFPYPNQVDKLPHPVELFPDLRDFPRNGLRITFDGTKEAIKTCIQYRHGVMNGKGASLINGYMEDLATDRIYRIMISQRLKYQYSNEKLRSLFFECSRELGDEYYEAAKTTLRLVLSEQFNPL